MTAMTTFRGSLLHVVVASLWLALGASAQAQTSMLRVSCDGADLNAEVSINGKFKGECPVDVPVSEGTIELRVVKKASATHERVYERTVRIGAGAVKREDVVLGAPQLNAEGRRLEAEKKRQLEVEDARQAAEQKRVARERELQQARRDEEERKELALPNAREQAPGFIAQARQLEQAGGADPAATFALYKKAADRQDPFAMVKVARRYENGVGVGKDVAAAMQWFKKAAELGNSAGMGGFSASLFNGYAGTADPAQARIWAEKAASAGDARGMNVMAVLNLDGKGGFAKDEVQAATWTERAFQGGDRRAATRAMLNLYNKSAVGAPDEVRAVALAQTLVTTTEDGEPPVSDALGMLGHAYDFGRGGLPKDEAKAYAFYDRGVEAGSIGAMYFGGMNALRGVGTPRNENVALAWLSKAADKGHANATSLLGQFHQFGWAGLPLDKAEAARHYRKALAAGSTTAEANLKSLGGSY
jgi:TPR repeat protein